MKSSTFALALCASLSAFYIAGTDGQLRAGDEHRNFDTLGSDIMASDSDSEGPPSWKRRSTDQCNCDAGHCDQRGCGPGATCNAGHCNQENLESPSCGAGHCNQGNATSPTCDAGHCNQRNAVDPTCGAGHCCQDNASNPLCDAGHCGCATCIGGDTPIFSCTADKIVSARDVSVGDQIRAVNAEKGESVCSDVYYVFTHEESDVAIRITTSLDDAFTVSYDHIVYVGETFEERRPVLSQNVKAGDTLVATTTSSNDSVKVLKVENVDMDLVNVLTIDPHLEIQKNGGIVISAHSVDEAAYRVLFAPIRYIYLMFGASAVEYMKPLFNVIDYSFAKPGLRMIK